MRCNKFDQELIAALKTFGFDIEDENVATVEDVKLTILWPADKSSMLLTIDLPNGGSLSVWNSVQRAQIIYQAECQS